VKQEERNRFGSPGLRLVQLYILLASSGRSYSLTRLARLMACSRQTILRMIDQIERIPKAECQTWMEKGERYFKIVPPTHANHFVFNLEILHQLVLCRDIVTHLMPQHSNQELQQNLRLLFPETVRDNAIAEPWGKGFIDYSPHQDTLDTIQDAMRLHRLCRIAYHSRSAGKRIIYLASPQRIIAYREALYLRCRLHDAAEKPADEYRTLAIHRIKSLRMDAATFRPDTRKDPEPDFGFPFHEPLRVRVAFRNGAADYVAERTWSPGQKITRRKDGTLLLTFTTTSRFEVLSWVLGFGPDAELLEPRELREEMKQKAMGILTQYTQQMK